MQLQTLALLDELIDSPPEWHKLLDNLERAITLSKQPDLCERPQPLPIPNTSFLSSDSSEHPDGSMFEANYNCEVQEAFRDILKFLTTFQRKISRVEYRARSSRFATSIKDSHIGAEVDRLDNEGTLTVERVDEIHLVQNALEKCQKQCKGAAFEVIQGKDSGKIQQMKNEFARMTKAIEELR